VTNISGVVATDSAFLSVGFPLDVERLLNYCRDGAYNNDRRNGVRKAHGQKNVDRGYPLALRQPAPYINPGCALPVSSGCVQTYKQTEVEPLACTGPFGKSRVRYRASRPLDHISAKNGRRELF